MYNFNCLIKKALSCGNLELENFDIETNRDLKILLKSFDFTYLILNSTSNNSNNNNNNSNLNNSKIQNINAFDSIKFGNINKKLNSKLVIKLLN